MLPVITTVETVVDHASIQSIVKTALVSVKLLAMVLRIPLLEMDFVMMKPIMHSVAMIMETAVCPIRIQIIALNALVTIKRLVLSGPILRHIIL